MIILKSYCYRQQKSLFKFDHYFRPILNDVCIIIKSIIWCCLLVPLKVVESQECLKACTTHYTLIYLILFSCVMNAWYLLLCFELTLSWTHYILINCTVLLCTEQKGDIKWMPYSKTGVLCIQRLFLLACVWVWVWFILVICIKNWSLPFIFYFLL